jgi:hypothetical protein
MADKKRDELPPKDKLITRPDEPLPSVQDPKQPRGAPADPKSKPPEGQGTDPQRSDIGRTA